MSGFWKVCSFLYSILGWTSFCMNYCINAAWHGVYQPVALLRCNEAQDTLIAAFCSSALLGLVSLVYILDGVQVWWVCWPIKHNNTMVTEPAFGSFGSVCRCQVLLENEISISIKLASRRKHEVLYNVLVDGCVDCGLQKTQWTNTSRRHGSPNHHWLWKLHTGLLQEHGFCVSPLFLQTLGPWFTNEMQHLLSSLEHWATVQFFFSVAQVRCFWRCFCFRSVLVALFLKMSECGDSWCTDSSFSSLLVKLSQVFQSALLDSILKLVVIPVTCAHSPT